MSSYNPQPVDLSAIELPKGVDTIVEQMAEYNHDVWARSRMNDGWTYGPERNDPEKKHPGLVRYDELSEGEKEYDRNTSMGAIKLLIVLGYKIEAKKTQSEDFYAIASVRDQHLFRDILVAVLSLCKEEKVDYSGTKKFRNKVSDIIQKAMIESIRGWDKLNEK